MSKSLEMRRKKSIDSFDEIDELNFKNKDNSLNSRDEELSREGELKSIRDLLDSLNEEAVFNEQEAGKATINTKVEDKDAERSFEEMSNEEIRSLIEKLFR